MTFSIIIPAYNASATIARAVQSCLDQSMPAGEIIVVDDGSTDATLPLLKSFGSRIKLLAHDSNRGVASARNTGWDAAKGDFLLFLDSDDSFHPRKIELVNKVLRQNPAISFLFHRYTLGEFMPIEPDDLVPRGISFFSVLLSNPAATPCIALRRDLPLRFNPRFRYCEDHELVVHATWITGARMIEAPLASLDHAVLSGQGLSSKRWKMRKGEMNMYAGIGRYHKALMLLVPFLLFWSLVKHLVKTLGH